jgi:hypothetical protein
MPTVGEVVQSISPRAELAFSRARGARYWPHNAYLILAIEGGLAALVLFLVPVTLAVGRYARGFWRWQLEQDALAASVLAFLVLGMAYNVAYSAHLWPLGLFLLGAWQGSMRN